MRAKTLFVALLLAALVLPLEAAGPFVISEFMSSNTKTLRDEDNSYQDWIEIYNTTSSNQNLGGHYLTDDPSLLTKWMFPALNVPPGGFVVVFASGKNRRVAGSPLHANFSLSAGGEYLALVRPDTVTKLSEFPGSLEQFPDISFGYLMSGVVTTNIAASAPVRALVPTGDIGTAWRGTNFDDSAWLSGNAGVGYDSGTNYLSAINLNLGAAMSNLNASAYLRFPFTLTNAAALKALTLRLRYDDGFIAYLNGTEVLRRNAPASAAWNSTATNYHGNGLSAFLTEDFEGAATNYTSSQLNAAPGPAIQSAGTGATGKYLRLLNDGVGNNVNAVTFRQTAPGLYQTITAEFDFRMIDANNDPADGFCFLLIPTATYGTNGVGITTSAPFEEPNYPGTFGVGFDVYPHATANDVSVHWNGTERLNVSMPRATFELVANQFHRARVTLTHVTGGARVSVTLRSDVNGTPGPDYTPIDNLFIPDLNPFDCRAEFAGRTGGSHVTVDLDNINIQFGSPPGPPAPEEFNLTTALPLLTNGPNVLAIHALNLSASDTNFLMSPELVTAAFQVSASSNYLSPATPGAWNNVTAAGRLGPVTISPPAGIYTNSVLVTLSSPSSSAQIRFTTNGTEPTATSPLYTSPLLFTANTSLRARAFEAGRIDGAIAAQNYLLLDNTLTNFTSNLPLVLIDTLGNAVGADAKTVGYAAFFDTNANGARVTLQQPADYTGRVAVEIAGQSSTQFPKKSYNLELRGEQDDDDKKVKLLGLPKGSDWRLYAPYTDKTLMNDFLAYELHEAMGHYAVRRKYVEVFMRNSVGKLSYSDYMGVYLLLEKIRISPERVDIDEPQSGTPDDPITGGYIWKKDKGSPGDIEFKTINQTDTIAASGSALQFHDPDGAKLTTEQKSWLTNHLMTFETVLYGANWRNEKLGYRAYIDVDSYVDFHWIVEFPKNIDGIRLSNYLRKDRGGLITEGPIWDWNLAWGNANYAEGGLTNGWYYPLISESQDMYLRRLRTDPDFMQKIIDRWGQLRTNIFALSNLIARIDAVTNYLNEAKDREFAKWPRLNTYVWPNPDGANLTSSDNSTAIWQINYAVLASYQQLIGEMKKWTTGRYAWVDAQYMVPPVLSLPSGFITPGVTLSITGPVGTLYYTLDGTDPRGSNGVLTSAAKIYSGPITLTNNAGVFARVMSGGNWSPPARGVYVVTTPALRITEVMYHPPNPPVGSTNSEEDFEFVEIQNTGTSSINLAGSQLAGGIQFTFGSNVLAPGQFAVVVKNLAAFQSRYGTGIAVAGEYLGKLRNSTDHLILTGPVGEPIHDFDYADGWYPITDGLGFSLVPRTTAGDPGTWNQSAAWRAGSVYGGSPGVADPLLAIPPVVVNEVLANSVVPAVDWVEVYNPLPTNVNIGGWFLTDDFSRPKKFRIPDGVVLAAGGYRVFTEAEFNPDPLNPASTNSFSLGSWGDEVFLFSADAAGNLTGYAEGFDFGASDEGVTFGRVVSSDGSVDYPALASATPGSANAAPMPSPLVISEIMYRPPDVAGLDNSVDEFVELQNVSGGPLPLFSSALPGVTWRVRNGVDFDFPTNVTLGAGEIILLVNFSPTNADAAAAFRSRYNVSPGVRLFGPYAGKLDNSGERIELQRPGQLDTNGVPYVMAEKVRYSDDPPWNGAADGAGASLQREPLSGYANDPAHWTAAWPTPGSAKPAGTAPVITEQPVGFTTVAETSTNVSVLAEGTALQYQWRFNGANVVGATNRVLAWPSISATNGGVYEVAVFNEFGAVMSQSATVTVRALPRFVISPVSQTNAPGSNTVLTAAASGTGVLRYQWRKDGTNILGATNSSLALPNVQLDADSAVYDVTVTDEVGTATSAPAYVVVKVAPYMVVTPGITNTALQGSTVVFQVNAGPVHRFLPLSYRYLPNPLSMGSYTNNNTTYYTNAFFVMTNVQTNGTLRIVLQNPVATANITSVALGAPYLVVLPDFDRDGVADAWEVRYGMNTNSAADAALDSDGDGMVNRDEFVAGTNPTNALSVLKIAFSPTNAALLQFQAESNISYAIQTRPDLNAGWQTWSNLPATNVVRSISFGAEATNEQRFYRVVVP